MKRLSAEELEAEHKRKIEYLIHCQEHPLTTEELIKHQQKVDKILGRKTEHLGMSFKQVMELVRSSQKKN